MQNQITKSIELKAPISRVWTALTDYKEFGLWFKVNIEAPFVTGQPAHGQITYPGYEHISWQVNIHKIESEKLFSFTWHPYAIDPNVDYSSETPTLVEFKLGETADGCLLTLTETGFDKIPEHRRDEAFQMNEDGWTQQMKNIEQHLTPSQVVS